MCLVWNKQLKRLLIYITCQKYLNWTELSILNICFNKRIIRLALLTLHKIQRHQGGKVNRHVCQVQWFPNHCSGDHKFNKVSRIWIKCKILNKIVNKFGIFTEHLNFVRGALVVSGEVVGNLCGRVMK